MMWHVMPGAAEPIIPELAKRLDDDVCCPHAAKVIMSAGPGGLGLAALADHLAAGVDADMEPNHRRALDLLREIRLRNRVAISPDILARLRDLVERPVCVTCGYIRTDEALREMIRNFLEENELDVM